MWPRQGATALVLGAGGAAAAVALALTRVPLLRLRIAARRQDAAEQPRRPACAAPATSRPSPGIAAAIARDGAHSAIVVNATSGRARRASVRSARPAAGVHVVDIRYRPRPVDVVSAAIEIGPPGERRARDASAAGIAQLRDLDRERRPGRCCPQRAARAPSRRERSAGRSPASRSPAVLIGLGSGWLAVALEKCEKLEDEEHQERLEYERDIAEALSRAAAAGEEPVAPAPWSGERYGWTWLERGSHRRSARSVSAPLPRTRRSARAC